jgi:hypothetical protein
VYLPVLGALIVVWITIAALREDEVADALRRNRLSQSLIAGQVRAAKVSLVMLHRLADLSHLSR